MASVADSPLINKAARIESTKEPHKQAAQKTHLSGKNLAAFSAALNEPMPAKTQALLAEESPWD
jgi:hypothetical protein